MLKQVHLSSQASPVLLKGSELAEPLHNLLLELRLVVLLGGDFLPSLDQVEDKFFEALPGQVLKVDVLGLLFGPCFQVFLRECCALLFGQAEPRVEDSLFRGFLGFQGELPPSLSPLDSIF